MPHGDGGYPAGSLLRNTVAHLQAFADLGRKGKEDNSTKNGEEGAPRGLATGDKSSEDAE